MQLQKSLKIDSKLSSSSFNQFSIMASRTDRQASIRPSIRPLSTLSIHDVLTSSKFFFPRRVEALLAASLHSTSPFHPISSPLPYLHWLRSFTRNIFPYRVFHHFLLFTLMSGLKLLYHLLHLSYPFRLSSPIITNG